MGNRNRIAYLLMYASQALLPLLALLGLRLDTNAYVYAALCALLALAAAVLTRLSAGEEKSALRSVTDLLLIPLAFLNLLFGYWACEKPAVLLFGFIGFGCCLVVSLSNNRQLVFKCFSAVLAVLLVLPTLLILFAAAFVEVSVVRTVDSPSGKRYAEVVDVDQGALGGSTLVNVVRRIASPPLFTLSAKPETVYEGPWGLFEEMEIYWKDDACLVIDGRTYQIR